MNRSRRAWPRSKTGATKYLSVQKANFSIGRLLTETRWRSMRRFFLLGQLHVRNFPPGTGKSWQNHTQNSPPTKDICETSPSISQKKGAYPQSQKSFLVSKPWQVWLSPAHVEFVTSDDPLVTFLRITKDLWHPGHGFRVPNVVAAFPLAPSACLTMGIAGTAFQKVDQATVTRVNEIVVRCSDRFIYSKTRSGEIAQIVNDAARTSEPGKTAFMGEFPDEKRIEEYLRRNMGIRQRNP